MMTMRVKMMKNIMMKKMIWKTRIFQSHKLGMKSIMTLIENSFQSQPKNNLFPKINQTKRAK